MARDLRKRVTLAIIIPLILGMIIITTTTCVPLYIEYRSYISQYNEHMLKNEKNTMLNLSKVIANTQSNGIFWYVAALAQLAGEFITNFYFQKIQKNAENPNLVQQYPGPTNLNNFNNFSYGTVFENYNIQSSKNFQNSTFLYYFMQPMTELATVYNNTVIGTFLAFEDNYFVMSPANQTLFSDFTNNNTLNFLKSVWWQKSQLALNNPLVFIRDNYTIVCRPLFRSGNIGTMPCVIFSVNDLVSEFSFTYSDNEKIIIVDEALKMYYASNSNLTDYCAYAFNYTCPGPDISPSTASSYFSQRFQSIQRKALDLHILDSNNSYSYSQITNTIYMHSMPNQYEVEDSFIISISPFNQSTPLIPDSLFFSNISVVLNTTKLEISEKFNNLSSKLTVTIIVQVIVFSLVLVAMIFFVCIISVKITGAVLSPIDDLYGILLRLHTDLGVDVKLHQKKGPPEIINLYEVFDKLRLILRFEDSQLFNDPAFAMMNYAQALRLFNDFNNKAAMEVCFEQIANVHMTHGRFKEAAINYYSSYNLAEELMLTPAKIAYKKVNTAKSLMAAKVKLQQARELFVEATNFYEVHDFKQKIATLLEFSECLLGNSENADNEISQIEKVLNRLPEGPEGLVLFQKFLYIKGLQAKSKGCFRESSEYFTESLENSPITDRETRKKSLSELKKIFQKFNIPTTQIKSLESVAKPGPKDLVLVVDSKIGGALSDEIILKFTESVMNPSDRLSFIQFDESCQVLFNLTRLPRRRCSTNTSLFDLRNVCVLNDAIYSALTQLISIKSLEPKSFLSNEAPFKEWVVVLTHGQDFGSKINDYTLIKELYESSASLVIVAVTPDEDSISKLTDIVKVTKHGLLIQVNNFSDIENGMLKAAAYIVQEREIMV